MTSLILRTRIKIFPTIHEGILSNVVLVGVHFCCDLPFSTDRGLNMRQLALPKDGLGIQFVEPSTRQELMRFKVEPAEKRHTINNVRSSYDSRTGEFRYIRRFHQYTDSDTWLWPFSYCCIHNSIETCSMSVWLSCNHCGMTACTWDCVPSSSWGTCPIKSILWPYCIDE